MSQQIVVDPVSLRAEGKSMAAVGDDFSAAVKDLSAKLEALEKGDTPPWGDDDLGEKFGVVYEGLRDGMKESMASLGTRIGEIGQKLQGMAASHEANESATDGSFRTMEGSQGMVGGRIGALHRPQVI
ncbi:WXG100 family type VII secretion target [Kitasatospora sp. P5_F3]